VLKVSAISSGFFNPNESKRLPVELLPLPELEVKKGDVLLSRANGVTELVGRCVYVDATPSKLMLSDKTLRLRPQMERVLPRMLCEHLKAESSRRQILNYISGSSGQKNLSQKQIGAIQIALAAVEEQEKICNLLNKSANQFEFDGINLNKIRALKTALMQDLLTGRKRVTYLLEPVAA
jgi:type I restriction enzyme S subunit